MPLEDDHLTRLAPGPLNRITDVDGIRVGNAEDARIRTGTTVILPDRPAVAAVDVRGGAPGTRETEVLNPSNLVEAIHGLVLSGGSAFGLDAASGVSSWLAARGRGFAVGPALVPIVPAAILFDLLNGGDKGWGAVTPYRALGIAACEAAGPDFALGKAGAGWGAKAGPLEGGLGSASILAPEGLQVGALAAVNAFGSTVMPGQDCFWAWALEQQGELGGQPLPRGAIALDADLDPPALPAGAVSTHTTLGVVATNAGLSKAEALRVAIMAQDGFARAIRPVHTPFDGDIVFALATGTWAMPAERAATLLRIGALAADCLARAVARGVYEAVSLGVLPCYRDRHGPAKPG
jgi:L-aminopeptidase/D-esterase-like protein